MWSTTRPSAGSWVAPVPTAVRWATVAGGTPFAPSSETRLVPVYPLTENAGGDLDFVHRLQSPAGFVIATGNRVRIESRITDGP